MRRGLLALVLIVGGLRPAAATGDTSLDVDERIPVVVMVTAPGRATPVVPLAELLGDADASLRPVTGLRVHSLEQAGIERARVDACPVERRFSCWVGIAAEARPTPAWLLVWNVLPGRPARLQALLIDVGQAQRRARDVPSTDPDRAERVEAAVFAEARHTEPLAVDLSDPEARRGAVREIVRERLGDVLDEGPGGAPLAELRLRGTEAGWAVRIEGRTVGLTGPGATLLRGLRGGTRRVELSAIEPAIEWALSAELGPGARVELDAGRPDRGPHPVRPALLWGGLATAAVGAGLVTWGASLGGVRVGCVSRAGEPSDCAGLRAARTGFDGAATPTTELDAVRGTGPALLPLGAALLGAGAGWVVGRWLGPDAELPWWGLGLGLVAGGAALAIGSAAGAP